MTRNGKIALLPGEIRDDLNQRLENGEEGATVLPWLNARREVRKILKEHFAGAAVTKQNLSEWRQGGFREWQIRQELLSHARQLSDADREMDGQVEIAFLPGALAGVLAARYAALLNGWDGEPDPKFEEKLRLLRGLNRDIALLQKTMQQASRQKKEFEQAAEEQAQREKNEEKDRLVAPILARVESEAIAAILQDGERGERLAEFMAAVKYETEMPRDWDAKVQSMRLKAAQARQAREAQSNPVQLSPTASAPAKPSPTGNEPAHLSAAESNPVAPDSAAERTPDAAPETPGDKD